MNIKPRGLYGSMQRMRDLQSRIDTLTPQNRTQQANKLQDVAPMPKSEIFSEFLESGFKPLNPNGPGLSKSLHRAPTGLLPMIQAAAEKYGVDPALFEALVGRESSFNPEAVSRAGAKGLAQLMSPTAKALGVTNVFDPEQNLNAGARYLSQMLKNYSGDVRMALGAYNAGPGTVKQVGGVPPESLKYVEDVIKMAGEIRGD